MPSVKKAAGEYLAGGFFFVCRNFVLTLFVVKEITSDRIMIKSVIRKLLVIAVILMPVAGYSGCKKQPRCGCGKDVILTLTKEPVQMYFSVEDNTVRFSPGQTFKDIIN